MDSKITLQVVSQKKAHTSRAEFETHKGACLENSATRRGGGGASKERSREIWEGGGGGRGGGGGGCSRRGSRGTFRRAIRLFSKRGLASSMHSRKEEWTTQDYTSTKYADGFLGVAARPRKMGSHRRTRENRTLAERKNLAAQRDVGSA